MAMSELTQHAPYVGGNSSRAEFQSTTVSSIVLPLICYVVFVVGSVGNSLVVYVMSRLSAPKKIADLFVINLAIADLIFLVTLLFWATEFLMHGQWVFGRILCKLLSSCSLFSAYSSVFFLTVMAIDRLGVVVLHKRYNSWRSMNKAVVVTVVLWVFSVTASLVGMYFRDTGINHVTGNLHCRWYFNESVHSHRTWICINFIQRFVIAFAAPLLITIICYIVIVIYLRKRKSKKKMLRQKQDRVTLTICVVIMVFIVCWTPNQISNFVYVAQGLHIIARPDPPSSVHYHIHLFATTLAWAHSCFNPFLYAFMREDVRHKLVEMTNRLQSACKPQASASQLSSSGDKFRSPSTRFTELSRKRLLQCSNISPSRTSPPTLWRVQERSTSTAKDGDEDEKLEILQKSSTV